MCYFKYPNLGFDVKNYFYQLFTTCLTQIGPKITRAQNFLKFGTFGISNMSISILMSKMIFIKYLPPRPKLVPKLKILRIYWNLTYLIFWISWSRFWYQIFFIKYLPIAKTQLVPKWKMLRSDWNLIKIEI